MDISIQNPITNMSCFHCYNVSKGDGKCHGCGGDVDMEDYCSKLLQNTMAPRLRDKVMDTLLEVIDVKCDIINDIHNSATIKKLQDEIEFNNKDVTYTNVINDDIKNVYKSYVDNDMDITIVSKMIGEILFRNDFE